MAERRVKIRFYAALKKRVADPPWPGGIIPLDWLLDGAPQRYEPATSTTIDADAPGLSHLTTGKNGTAYVTDPNAEPDEIDPDVLFGEVLDKSEDILHFRVWRVRRSLLPSLHNFTDGTTSPIGLAKSQGIAEAADLILFVKSCVVGWLVNRAGPSQRDVLAYLDHRTAVNMKLIILPRDDALDLVRGELVRAVDVEVAAGQFEALVNITPDIAAAAKTVDTPGLRTIRVSLSAEQKHGGAFWQWWLPRARKLIGLGSQHVERIEVTQGGTDEIDAQTIDLLAQVIGLEKVVPVQTGRTVDAAAARTAIINGFNTHQDLIARAADGLDVLAENQRTERRRRA